jgi:hypothetical protein
MELLGQVMNVLAGLAFGFDGMDVDAGLVVFWKVALGHTQVKDLVVDEI